MKKLVSMLMVGLLLVTLLGGCTKDDKEGINQKDEGTKDEQVTLTYWVPMHVSAAKQLKSYNEMLLYQELEKRTGVHIEFIHPPKGQEKEQYNLMISSGDLPDIIEYAYPNGGDAAIAEEIYIRLNELIDEHAPNYKKLLESDPDIMREIKTDEGNIWAFDGIHKDVEPPWAGPVVRYDWLEELNMERPTTIQEWEDMLVAFKEKGVEIPLSWNINDWLHPTTNTFISSFGIGADWYQVDGKVQFGPIQPEYKDFLALMKKWYDEGLLDKDFATRDWDNVQAMLTSGQIGAILLDFGTMDYFNGMMIDDPFLLKSALHPSMNKGENVHFKQTNNHKIGAPLAITTKCEDPVAAVKWADYSYSEEGALLNNWGVEGDTFEMVDGKPQYTDKILNSPEGIAYDVIISKYRRNAGGPYLRDWAARPPFNDIILEAYDLWDKAENDMVYPWIELNKEEKKEYSSKYTDISTYIEEMNSKFIMGIESLDNFDNFVNQIKQMGIDDCIKLKQEALDRYNLRK